MIKKIILSATLAFAFFSSKAGYSPVTVTGFNIDAVANGVGAPAISSNESLDALLPTSGYAFCAQDYNYDGTCAAIPTPYFLPSSGLLTSTVTPGLTFQLANYSGNNVMRLHNAQQTGTLTFTTPASAETVYLLANSGAAASVVNVTVNFTDLTSQTFTGTTIADWYGGANVVIKASRVIRTKITCGNDGNPAVDAGPNLYQYAFALNSANYSKLIASITLTRTSTGNGYLNAMGVSIYTNLPCVTPAAQPTALVLNASASAVNVAFTPASPAADKYLVVMTPNGAALTATPVNGTIYLVGGTLGNGTIVSASNSTNFLNTGLTANTQYRYTIFSYNDVCAAPGPLYNTTNPLTGTVTTSGVTTYTWNGSVSTNWTVAGNWTPARNVPDVSDILQFNNGANNTVTNIPTQTIGRLLFSNSTTANFQAPSTATLSITSDNNSATNELDIPAGSALISNGTSAALSIVFTGTGATVAVGGNLESASTAFANIINFANTVTTVAATGSITGGGTSGTNVLLGSAATLIMNGTYNHKYTTASGPAIPTATWNAGSTVLISGYTTATGGPNGGLNQVFSNFTYNCTNQTSNTNWSGTGPLQVSGTFTMASTGTGTLQWSSTQGYQYVVNNYVQTGGTLNMNSGTATAPPTLNLSGNFNQTGGTFTSTGASSGANAPTINFAGTTTQNVNFFNAAPVGPIVYRINNANGINLTGTGTLTGTFNINNSGGVRISALATDPINTTLALTYAANSTLTYDAPGSLTATAAVWPSATGPAIVSLNTGGSNNVLTLPFNRTIATALTMNTGDIDLGANTLTLGTSAAATGTLIYNTGNMRLTTGSFVRWYGTTALPTTAGNATGFYPVAYGGANRNVAIYFSSATALSAGGTIGVSHNNVSGFTNSLSVADGAYTIDTRTNSNWSFAAGGGITATGTLAVKMTGAALFSSSNAANLRVMYANSVAGTHSAGSGVSAFRTGLSLANLTSGAMHIGAAAVDITGVYIAINTGLWSAGSTWDIGSAPGIANEAFINTGVTVTANGLTNTAKALTLFAGGTLNVAAGNTVTIDSALLNNGTINLTGGNVTVNGNSGITGVNSTGASLINIASGTMTVGPSGGGNKPFVSAGTLSVGSGNLIVNGNFQMSFGSTLVQSGGDIRVDGNAAGSQTLSVASPVVIVSLQSPNLTLTGGTFTIVDPHASTLNVRTFEYNTTLGHINLPATHTFVFGDGISTDPGGFATNGYRINQAFTSSRMQFGSVIINGAAGTNRFVSPGNQLGVAGNFTINNGGEYRTAGSGIYINGNLTVNTGGTLTADAAVIFANYANAAQASGTNAQTVSGAGTFRNNATTVTANFTSLTIQNSNGVTFNIGNPVFSGTTTFTAGSAGPSRITMAANSILCERAGAGQAGASATNGWLNGRYQKGAAVGGMNHNFPIGDATYYTPVNVSGTASIAGDIWAGTTTLDHPNINTATLNSGKSVNRYYTIQAVNGLTTSAATATFNWNAADVDAPANTGLFIVGKYNAGPWTYPTFASPLATSIQATGLAAAVSGEYQIAEPCGATTISTPPASQTICTGSPVTFSVVAAGSGISYQWQFNTVNIPGATNASYTIPATVAGDAGNYTVAISSICGGAPLISAIGVLTLTTPPAISTPPATQAICQGSPVTFSVTATGTGITYQWKKNTINITGATNATYSIPAVVPGDAGNYTVTVTGTSPCGNITSAIAVLTVNPLDLTVTPPGPIVFCAGGSITLNAVAAANATYEWKLNGNPIPGQTNASHLATVSGNVTVTIVNTVTGCNGTSAIVNVTANSTPPSTITPSPTASFCAGNSITLVGNTGAGFNYQWQLGGVDILGATNSNYTTTTAGSYTLKVSVGTGCNTTSVPTVVTINPLPASAINAGGPTTFCQGGSVTLSANTGAGLTYVWKSNGVPIVPAATNPTHVATTSGNYTVDVTNANTCVQGSNTIAVTVNPLPAATITAGGPTTFCQGANVVLTAPSGTGLAYIWKLGTVAIPNATNASHTATAAGSYTVQVTNTATGCFQTSAATVITVNPLPSTTVTPAGPIDICQGGNAVITVTSAAGLSYQWMLNTVNIPGALNPTYTATAAGNYTVKVTNNNTGCNATSAIVVVNVNPLPIASINPSGTATICNGDTMTLTGTPGVGFSYQWKLGTVNIVGATNGTYKATVAGNYTVVVTNNFTCSATSPATTVVVNPRPLSVISYTSPIVFCKGGAVNLEANLGTNLTYQWSNTGTAIAGATNSTFIADTSGIYIVVVTNSVGCSASSGSVIVTVNPLPEPIITRNHSVLSTGNYVYYEWYKDGFLINGATNKDYTFTQNGAYYVRVTDANGCINVSSPFFINNVGVHTVNMGEAIKIYPNPAQSVVNIESPVEVNVMVRDLSGRIVLSKKDAKQLDLSELSDGIYMLFVTDKDGHMMRVEKLQKTQ